MRVPSADSAASTCTPRRSGSRARYADTTPDTSANRNEPSAANPRCRSRPAPLEVGAAGGGRRGGAVANVLQIALLDERVTERDRAGDQEHSEQEEAEDQRDGGSAVAVHGPTCRKSSTCTV